MGIEVQSKLLIPIEPQDGEEAARLMDIPGADLDTFPVVTKMFMLRGVPGMWNENLTVTFDKPVNFPHAYLQLLRLGKKSNALHRSKEFRPVTLSRRALYTWATIPITEGATEITLNKAILDRIYRPPQIRKTSRDWVDWAGHHSGKRHDQRGVQGSTVIYRFRVAQWIHEDIQNDTFFQAGAASVQTLKIKEFTMTNFGVAERRRKYEIF